VSSHILFVEVKESRLRTIRELRQNKGLTQLQLANELGVTLSTVYNWERRTHEPKASQVKAVATLFEVSMEEIDFAPERSKSKGEAIQP